MTVLSRISLHFGATQRTRGEKLHTSKTDNTDGDRGASVENADPLHNTITPHSETKNKNHIYRTQPASTARHKNIKPKGDFCVSP